MIKTKKAILILLSLICWGLLVFTILTIADNPTMKIINGFNIVFVVLYIGTLFVIPHGNLLKYCMLLLAFSQLLDAILYISAGQGPIVCAILYAVASIVIAYCSGRLHKNKENRMLFPCCFLFILASAMIYIFNAPVEVNFSFVIDALTFPLLFLSIASSYFIRFEEHKKAGLDADAAIK